MVHLPRCHCDVLHLQCNIFGGVFRLLRSKHIRCIVSRGVKNVVWYDFEFFCFAKGRAFASHLARTFVCFIMVLYRDVHHGNGTSDIFYDDDEVMYASIHRFGMCVIEWLYGSWSKILCKCICIFSKYYAWNSLFCSNILLPKSSNRTDFEEIAKLFRSNARARWRSFIMIEYNTIVFCVHKSYGVGVWVCISTHLKRRFQIDACVELHASFSPKLVWVCVYGRGKPLKVCTSNFLISPRHNRDVESSGVVSKHPYALWFFVFVKRKFYISIFRPIAWSYFVRFSLDVSVASTALHGGPLSHLMWYVFFFFNAGGFFFPQTGDHTHIGKGKGKGYTVNVPVPYEGMCTRDENLVRKL